MKDNIIYPHLTTSKLIDTDIPPVGLVFIVRKTREDEQGKYTVDKVAVEFFKYTRDNEGHEKVLEEVADRDDFVCWVAECEMIPFTDEQLQELSQYKEIGLAMLSNTKLKLPKYILNERKI